MARRVPDWAIYAAVVAGLAALSLITREAANATPAPPAPSAVEEALLGPITPFDTSATVQAPDPFQPQAGTAFSVAAEGRWLTARHVVEGCRRPALAVGGGRAVQADVRLAKHADVALLITQGGPAALGVDPLPLPQVGQRAFHPGFPQGHAGEITSRLLGPDRFRGASRGRPDEPVLAWAEVGRTRGLRGSLSGLSGAPVLDEQGQVMGITIAASPRRGRIYTTAPARFAAAVRGIQPANEPVQTTPLTVDNYGLTADALRRDLRIAQVVCLG